MGSGPVWDSMPGLLFEEFADDMVIEHPQTLLITMDDNVAYCKLTHNEQPLHLSKEAAQAAGFKDVLINGLYTFSAAVGMSVPDLTEGTLIANLGYEDVRHPAPVYPGDTIRVTSRILEKRESSKPGRGIVRIESTVTNQDGVVVCAFKRAAMVRRS